MEVTAFILLSMSLLPEESILPIFDRIGKDGKLTLAVFPHIRYDRAYAVLSPEDFAEHDRRRLNPVGPGGFGEILTTDYLAPIRGPGPVSAGRPRRTRPGPLRRVREDPSHHPSSPRPRD